MPTPGVSTPERSRIAGEWMAPAHTTTRSASISSPATVRTATARRPSNTIRSTSVSPTHPQAVAAAHRLEVGVVHRHACPRLVARERHAEGRRRHRLAERTVQRSPLEQRRTVQHQPCPLEPWRDVGPRPPVASVIDGPAVVVARLARQRHEGVHGRRTADATAPQVLPRRLTGGACGDEVGPGAAGFGDGLEERRPADRRRHVGRTLVGTGLEQRDRERRMGGQPRRDHRTGRPRADHHDPARAAGHVTPPEPARSTRGSPTRCATSPYRRSDHMFGPHQVELGDRRVQRVDDEPAGGLRLQRLAQHGVDHTAVAHDQHRLVAMRLDRAPHRRTHPVVELGQGLATREGDAERVVLPCVGAVLLDERVERHAVAVGPGVVLAEAVVGAHLRPGERRRRRSRRSGAPDGTGWRSPHRARTRVSRSTDRGAVRPAAHPMETGRCRCGGRR